MENTWISLSSQLYIQKYYWKNKGDLGLQKKKTELNKSSPHCASSYSQGPLTVNNKSHVRCYSCGPMCWKEKEEGKMKTRGLLSVLEMERLRKQS